MSKVYLVYERTKIVGEFEEDLVLSVCSSEEEAQKQIKRYSESRLKFMQHNTEYDRDRFKISVYKDFITVEGYAEGVLIPDMYEYYISSFTLDIPNNHYLYEEA